MLYGGSLFNYTPCNISIVGPRVKSPAKVWPGKFISHGPSLPVPELRVELSEKMRGSSTRCPSQLELYQALELISVSSTCQKDPIPLPRYCYSCPKPAISI